MALRPAKPANRLWRLKSVLNWLNLSTPLGLGIARAGRARVEHGPRGLYLASEYAFRFPKAGAFTVGNVVVTARPNTFFQRRPRLLAHEERHSWQWAALLGLPFLPAYVAASALSWIRGGDASTHNFFETRAGLIDGGYPPVSARARARLGRDSF